MMKSERLWPRARVRHTQETRKDIRSRTSTFIYNAVSTSDVMSSQRPMTRDYERWIGMCACARARVCGGVGIFVGSITALP